MTPDRWQQLMDRWHAPASEPVFEQLRSAYSEPQRHYHAVAHIEDCLRQLDAVSHLTSAPHEVELALWFHDAIYKPTSSINELDSAEWAAQFVEFIGGTSEQRERIHSHIMATQHTGEALTGDAAIVVDIDVSILGSEPPRYDVYEAAIRREYRWVPRLIYRRKRIEVLKSFLAREALYSTEHFRTRLEEQARANLARAIEELEN